MVRSLRCATLGYVKLRSSHGPLRLAALSNVGMNLLHFLLYRVWTSQASSWPQNSSLPSSVVSWRSPTSSYGQAGGAILPIFAFFFRDWQPLQLCVSLPQYSWHWTDMVSEIYREFTWGLCCVISWMRLNLPLVNKHYMGECFQVDRKKLDSCMINHVVKW